MRERSGAALRIAIPVAEEARRTHAEFCARMRSPEFPMKDLSPGLRAAAARATATVPPKTPPLGDGAAPDSD